MKKIFTSIGSVLIVGCIIGFVAVSYFPERLVPFMLNQQLKNQAKIIAEGEALLNDQEAITVVTVGTASPMPGERVQTGTAVFVNGHFFMFDVGDGVVQKAENLGLPLNRLDGIFITHWHSDHMIDLPSIISRSWLLGRATELHLYGPKGTDTLNQAINQFLHIENKHRVDHHGAEIMDVSKARAIPHEFTNAAGGTTVVYNQDGIKITAFNVDHEPIVPAVGYVIEYKGKKIVLSGDTKRSDALIDMAQGADLLFHEIILNSLMTQMVIGLQRSGMNRNARIIHDIQDYHTPPSDVAEIAKAAQVKKLVLYHFAPAPDLKVIENLYKKELVGYSGPIHFANDGDRFVVN